MKAATTAGTPRVLLFVHQLPKGSSSVLRARVWARLQDLLAIALRGGVHVMTDTVDGRRELQAIAAEVQIGGGYASVFSAVNLNRLPNLRALDDSRALGSLADAATMME